MQNPNLFLIQHYYQLQEHRLALASQLLAYPKEHKNETFSLELLEKYHEQFSMLEKSIVKDINAQTKNHPMRKWLDSIKGIGVILGASLLFVIDIKKADHASSVWKYAGLDVAPDGRGRGKYKEHLIPKEYKNDEGKIKKTVGITFNPFLKTTCWKIGESFIKQKNSPYRQIYVSSKALYHERDPKMSKLHCHNRARRKAVKIFLSHFWAEWRGSEGLPVSEPYAHKK